MIINNVLIPQELKPKIMEDLTYNHGFFEILKIINEVTPIEYLDQVILLAIRIEKEETLISKDQI